MVRDVRLDTMEEQRKRDVDNLRTGRLRATIVDRKRRRTRKKHTLTGPVSKSLCSLALIIYYLLKNIGICSILHHKDHRGHEMHQLTYQRKTRALYLSYCCKNRVVR